MAIQLTVVYSPAPREVHEVTLTMDEGATVVQGLRASGLLERFPEINLEVNEVGVWGHAARAGQYLRDRDRVEIYRSLIVDPKVARRERFQKQGARTTGLFARKRPGAKTGY